MIKGMIKKGLCLVLTASIAVGAFFQGNNVYASEEAGSSVITGLDTSQNADTTANLVVYVNLKDSTHSHINSAYGKCFLEDANLEALFYGNDAKRSLRYYTNKISYGNVRVANIFPQYDSSTGKIIPITLDKTAEQYGSSVGEFSDVFVRDVVQKLASSGYVNANMILDRDNDGCIDNMTIVVACESGNTNTVFYGLSSSYAGVSYINNKRVAKYNIIPEGGAYMGTTQSGVIIHEYMHSLGFPDLYRSPVTPVGTWDIMSSVYLYLQYPLAYTRSYFGGWFNIPVVTADQKEYSIYSAEAGTSNSALKDNQAVILKTPYSDNEFFVVEYRKKTSTFDATEPFDATIYGSGLVIYRVNNNVDYKTNAGTAPYFMYVFRPGDKYNNGIEAAGGTPTYSYLSAESGRTSYGSSDLELSLEEGAITYSDGTNSGIVISNVGSTSGDSITFDISFTDLGNDFWTVDDSIKYSENLSQINTCIDSNGHMYVAEGFCLDNKLVINEIVNGKVAGSPIATITDYSAGGKIVEYGGDIYVAYIDKTYHFKLSKIWNGNVTKVYSTSSYVGNDVDLCAGKDGIYATYSSDDCNTVYTLKYDGTNCSLLENLSANYAANISITVMDNVPYVAFREFFSNEAVAVNAYINSKWTRVGNLSVKAVNLDIENDGKNIYLASCKSSFSSETLNNVWIYDGNSWNKFSENEYSAANVASCQLTVCNGVATIIFQEGSGKLKVAKLTGTAFENIGNDVAKANVQSFSGVFDGEKLYAMYCDCNNSDFVIKSHSIGAKEAVPEENVFTGLKYVDSTWYYYRNGKIDWNYNSLAYANNAWWYINNGVLDKTYTGLVPFRNQLWYVNFGKLDKTFAGKVNYNDETYSVKNGVGSKTSAYTGLKYNNGVWEYYTDGILDIEYKGVTVYNGNTWFIENGTISRKSGIWHQDGDIYYIIDGKVDISVYDLKYNDGSWYYFRRGRVDWSYNTLTYVNNTWWYVNHGKLDKTYTGLCLYNGKLWYVKEGKLDKCFKGTVMYEGKNYSVTDGVGVLEKN